MQYNDREYEIVYHRGYFFWQDSVNIKTLWNNLTLNHWEVNEVRGRDANKRSRKGRFRGYSTINCLRHGHGIIRGLFPRKKMKKQLEISARCWDSVGREK